MFCTINLFVLMARVSLYGKESYSTLPSEQIDLFSDHLICNGAQYSRT
jgi:hypothetical protein